MRLRLIALISSLLALACGFADIFRSGKVGDVVLTYTGPTAMTVGDRAAISVSVTVAGEPLPDPRIFITSSDTAIVVVSSEGDSIFARGRGFGKLTIKLMASIFTDSFPAIIEDVRVNP